MFQITVGGSGTGFSLKDWLTVGGPILALAGVVITSIISFTNQRKSIAAGASQQRSADDRRYGNELALREREKQQAIATARGVIFAQLCRVYRSIQGEYGYLARSDLKFIWLSFYSSLLPTVENLKRTELLTPDEVISVTAFYYSYHEQMGYITSASGGRDKTEMKFDFHMVGVDFRAAHLQLKWVMDALGIIERKSHAAMAAILSAVNVDHGPQDPLYLRLKTEVINNQRTFQSSRLFAREIWECIRFAEAQAQCGPRPR